MQRTNHKSERGQAVVIIVVAMVVLLGFTALAVDGSMVYSDRRYAQSAADSSSLAGGTRLAQDMEANGISNSDMEGTLGDCSNVPHMRTITSVSRQAAKQRAGDNDFVTFSANMTAAQLAEQGTGAVTRCGKDPVLGTLATGQKTVLYDQYYVEIQTQITDQTETAFAHFVYGGKLENTVTATTRVFPRQPLAYGYAIVALNPKGCSGNTNGMHFNGLGGGKNMLTVQSGGIFSNGCMDMDGNADVNLESTDALNAYYFATANHNTLGNIDFPANGSAQKLADINSNRLPLSTYDIPMPDCSGHEVKSSWVTGYSAAHPGNVWLPAGLYCVTDELKINSNDIVKGDKVTFVLLSGMTINGNADVDLRMRYSNDPDNGDGSIAGVLFYQPRNITAPITVNGNTKMTLRGSWIAPGAPIEINGSADKGADDDDRLRVFGQIVGYNVSFGGSTNILVDYIEEKVASRPARLELHK